jgi:hypothetical protein
MGDAELRADLRELREGNAALLQKVSDVGNGLHGHVDQIETQLVEAEARIVKQIERIARPEWWEGPARGMAWMLVGILSVGAAGWLAKESLLPPGYLERLLDAILESVKRVG